MTHHIELEPASEHIRNAMQTLATIDTMPHHIDVMGRDCLACEVRDKIDAAVQRLQRALDDLDERGLK